MLNSNGIEAYLVEKKFIGKNAIELCYRAEQTIRYLPGQFYSVRFSHNKQDCSRSYSVVNKQLSPLENYEFRFVITLVEGGKASQYFLTTELGSRVTLSGPYGNLVLPRIDPKRYVMVATGAGVAPYRAMIPELTQRLNSKDDLEIVVLMGAKTKEELLYSDEFIDWANTNARVKYLTIQSRVQNPEDPKPTGHVQNLIPSLQLDPQSDMAYVCGNPQMVDQVVSMLGEKGFPVSSVKREKYLFSAF
jgi:NAD(P)H-flavin reductase